MRVSRSEYEMLAKFRYSLRKFLRFSEDAATNAGLTPQQHQAMLAIKAVDRNHRVTIKELAERLQIRHNSAVGLVDRLVHLGLVERVADTVDKRCVSLALTPVGDEVLDGLAYAHKEELRRIAPQLTELFGRLLSEQSDDSK